MQRCYLNVHQNERRERERRGCNSSKIERYSLGLGKRDVEEVRLRVGGASNDTIVLRGMNKPVNRSIALHECLCLA